MSGKCGSPEELIQRQAVALKETILEAKTNEQQRVHQLATAHSRGRELELNKRYEVERRYDEGKIVNLMDDLARLKAGVASGQFIVNPAEKAVLRNPSANSNRFAGADNANDLVSSTCGLRCVMYQSYH